MPARVRIFTTTWSRPRVLSSLCVHLLHLRSPYPVSAPWGLSRSETERRESIPRSSTRRSVYSSGQQHWPKNWYAVEGRTDRNRLVHSARAQLPCLDNEKMRNGFEWSIVAGQLRLLEYRSVAHCSYRRLGYFPRKNPANGQLSSSFSLAFASIPTDVCIPDALRGQY